MPPGVFLSHTCPREATGSSSIAGQVSRWHWSHVGFGSSQVRCSPLSRCLSRVRGSSLTSDLSSRMGPGRVVASSVQFSTCCWDGIEVKGFKQRITYLTYILQTILHLPYCKKTSHPTPVCEPSAASRLAELLKNHRIFAKLSLFF